MSSRHIVATSDFHGKIPTIPECDLLLIAGDLCPPGSPSDQARWLDTTFRTFLDTAPAKEIVSIAGNHDHIFANAPELTPQGLRHHYLQDQSLSLFGLTIYGTPWQLPFYGAFNQSDGRLAHTYEAIPDNTDIVISHGAPFGIRDKVGNTHTGSKSLLKRMFEVKPKLCLFGHIHDQYGQHEEQGITFANVSLVNDTLQIAHNPVSFHLCAC